MPGLDGTGPRGLGPMTGGGRGFCALPLGGQARFASPMSMPGYQPYGAAAGPWSPFLATPMPWMYGHPWALRPWGVGFGRGMGLGFGRGMGIGFGRGRGMGIGRGMGLGRGMGGYRGWGW
jgi:hypothetical protein